MVMAESLSHYLSMMSPALCFSFRLCVSGGRMGLYRQAVYAQVSAYSWMCMYTRGPPLVSSVIFYFVFEVRSLWPWSLLSRLG